MLEVEEEEDEKENEEEDKEEEEGEEEESTEEEEEMEAMLEVEEEEEAKEDKKPLGMVLHASVSLRVSRNVLAMDCVKLAPFRYLALHDTYLMLRHSLTKEEIWPEVP
ncbi:uncharacterized, partial [Tachysurus ichikawai]